MAVAWNQKGSLKGAKGDPGNTGPQGPQGYSFRVSTVALTGGSSVQTSSISPSTNIQVGDKIVDINGEVFNVTHVGDSSVNISADNEISLRGPQGLKGDPGEKGEDGTGVNIKGSVANSSALPDTGEAGDAYVTTDTGNLWIWDEETQAFVDTGAQIKGPQGEKGDQGDPGAAATINVGTVSTGAAGTQASVVNGGTTSAAVLNFTIPRGETGAAGPGVSVGSGAPSEAGTVGECYIDIDTGILYRYEESN